METGDMFLLFWVGSKCYISCICYCEKPTWWIFWLLFFIVNMFESYIVECKLGLETCILINIQRLLFIKTCWKQLVKYLSMVPMLAYVCYWYFNDYNFWIYNICIAIIKCWLLNHLFGLRRMFSSFLANSSFSCQ